MSKKQESSKKDQINKLKEAYGSEDFEKDIKRLKKAGIDLNIEVDGSTLLQRASIHDEADKVKVLIECDVDLDAQNSSKETALYLATIFDSKEIVELLINAGANPELKDHLDDTPLDIARDRGYKKIVNLLEAGIDLRKAAENSAPKPAKKEKVGEKGDKKEDGALPNDAAPAGDGNAPLPIGPAPVVEAKDSPGGGDVVDAAYVGANVGNDSLDPGVGLGENVDVGVIGDQSGDQ